MFLLRANFFPKKCASIGNVTTPTLTHATINAVIAIKLMPCSSISPPITKLITGAPADILPATLPIKGSKK